MRQDFSAVIRARRNALGMNQSRLAEISYNFWRECN